VINDEQYLNKNKSNLRIFLKIEITETVTFLWFDPILKALSVLSAKNCENAFCLWYFYLWI